MDISLAFSPCPNDTFIFDALIHNRIDTMGYNFIPVYLDVEDLNKSASSNKYDVSKMSYFAWPDVSMNYIILQSGGALGFGCGPLLVCRKDTIINDFSEISVAIPGERTTANLLLQLAFPQILKRIPLLFSEIEDAVVNRQFDAGLIIHENRFTYQDKGLSKIADLGEWWEKEFSLPIPLGCIAAKRSLSPQHIHNIDSLISKSIQYAFDHPQESNDFVMKYAQNMSAEVAQKHINLYVNEFSISLGKQGKDAVMSFFNNAKSKKMIQDFTQPVFA